MPYLIDGHNLIGVLPDLDLADIDDERKLLEKLTRFCAATRRKVNVYFDHGQLENGSFQGGPFLKAFFIRSPRTADDAIKAELVKLGRTAANWTVVSSDREVQRAARMAGARIINSDAFIDVLEPSSESEDDMKADTTLSDDEIDRWIAMFQGGEE